jgi:hypothetical protein
MATQRKTLIETRIAEMIDYLQEHYPARDDGPIVAPGIMLDGSASYLGRLESDMQYAGACKRPRGRPQYMVRLFIQRIGGSKQDRDRLSASYGNRFRRDY